jgi:hypothetical protein
MAEPYDDGGRRYKLSCADGFAVPTAFFAACSVWICADGSDKKPSAQGSYLRTLGCHLCLGHLQQKLETFVAIYVVRCYISTGNECEV